MLPLLNRLAGIAISAVLITMQAHVAGKALYAFKGGSDGAVPYGALLQDSSGDLYGTTGDGGSAGFGTVFKLGPGGLESVLYAFHGGSDGAYLFSALTIDSANNLYGTTLGGDAHDHGTVFELTPDGTESVLYNFTGGSDGDKPDSPLVRDGSGNLYGTTPNGGNFGGSDCGDVGCGVVFEISPTGGETVLYAFQGASDGWTPFGGVIRDSGGDLYGATGAGGTGNGNNCGGGDFGCGTVFEVTSGGAETVLYSFQGGSSDGYAPSGPLLMDSAGNLYGATANGGRADAGTVFKLAPNGTETILYAFQRGSSGDGVGPVAGLIMDKAGNLYGTTEYGGNSCVRRGGCGAVFKLTPKGHESILYSFNKRHGAFPVASLLLGSHGKLYGTASAGGKFNDGVVFEVKK